MDKQCTHLDQIQKLSPDIDKTVCKECIALGDTWVNLRQCLICGHVGCCDDSKNKHATKHFHATNHPLMQSVSPGEQFVWCYVDEVMMDPSVADKANGK